VHESAKIVKGKFNRQNTTKLNGTQGVFQSELFSKGSAENKKLIVFLSPYLMKSTG